MLRVSVHVPPTLLAMIVVSSVFRVHISDGQVTVIKSKPLFNSAAEDLAIFQELHSWFRKTCDCDRDVDRCPCDHSYGGANLVDHNCIICRGTNSTWNRIRVRVRVRYSHNSVLYLKYAISNFETRSATVALKRPCFPLAGGVLLHKDPRLPGQPQSVVPRQVQDQLVQESHDGRFSGHFAKKT